MRAVYRASAATLPPELHAVVLGLLADRSLAEIVQELDVDLTRVRLRLLRARALLRRELWAYVDPARPGTPSRHATSSASTP